MSESSNKYAEEVSQSLLESLPDLLANEGKGLDTKAKTNLIVQRIRDMKLMSVVVPEIYDGQGCTLRETCNLISVLSSVSGSAGLIYAMHLSQLLSLVKHHAENRYLTDYLMELSANQYSIASATSEKGAGGDIFGSICRISKSASELTLKKEVPNISYVDLADALLVTALHHDDQKKQALILVRKQDSHVEPGFTGSFIGMKGIFNASYTINAKFGDEAIFSEPFPGIARSTMTASTQIMWACVWSGIAFSALEKARTFIRKELKHSPETQKEMSVYLSTLANKQYVINSLIAAAVAEFENSGGGEVDLQASARINRLKITCSELVNQICYGALSICGLRGYSEGGPYSLAENIGDALSAPLMVSNFRLLQNNSSIENFVDESLSL